MATINTKGQMAGAVGPVVFRTLNGVRIAQSKPGKGGMKQTKATRSAASDFGKASTSAKMIRLALYPILQNHTDSGMYRRFAAKVYEAVQADSTHPKGSRTLANGDLSQLVGFEGNTASPFARYCSLVPELQYDAAHNIVLSVPAHIPNETYRAVDDATHAELCLLFTALDPQTLAEQHSELFKVPVTLNNQSVPAQQFTVNALAGEPIIAVTAAVFYFRRNNLAGPIPLNGKELHPCMVVSAFRNGQ